MMIFHTIIAKTTKKKIWSGANFLFSNQHLSPYSFFLFLLIILIKTSPSTTISDSQSKIVLNRLLPAPQVIEQLAGTTTLSNESFLYYSEGNKDLVPIISRFLELFEERHQQRLSIKTINGLDEFQIRISNKSRNQNIQINAHPDLKSKGEEAYTLTIQPDGIFINANSSKGTRWALMTLLQLGIGDNEGKVSIPAVKIYDWPRYRWRGYMLDTGRAPYSIEQIKRTIRVCSTFKLNFLMLREGDDELNAFKFNNLRLGHNNPFALTIDNLSELIKYGEKHGIVVFPEIESLGHAAAKRFHYPDLVEGDMYSDYWPGFSHLRKANLKVGNPGTYQLLTSIYEELFPLLIYPMVHLGLDEVRLSKEKQSEHLRELLPVVDKTGHKFGHKMEMIVWSDAPPTPPEYHDRVIRCLWVYDETVSLDNPFAKMQGIETFIQPDCRQKVFISAGSGTKHRPYSKGSYKGAFENLTSWTMLGKEYPNFIGVLAVQWGTNIIDEWFPNFLMAAEFAWNVPDKVPDYTSTMDCIMYNLQKLNDFSQPDPASVDRPAWDGIWLKGRYFDEDIMTGEKASPVVDISPEGEFFYGESSPIKIESNFPQTKIYYTVDGTQPNRQSNYYYEPIRVKGTTTIRAIGFLAGRQKSYTKTQVFASLDYQDPVKSEPLSPGIRYDYFITDVFSVLDLSDKDLTDKGISDYVTIIDQAESEEKFGLVFLGYIQIKKQGLYTFFLNSNDGSKLYVNEKELIDNNGRHPSIEKIGKIALKTGDYPIKVTYFQNGGGKGLKLSWSAKWFDKEEISPQVLFHAK